jgi:hypothetical protein
MLVLLAVAWGLRRVRRPDFGDKLLQLALEQQF